jgi:hypothetical protein
MTNERSDARMMKKSTATETYHNKEKRLLQSMNKFMTIIHTITQRIKIASLQLLRTTATTAQFS